MVGESVGLYSVVLLKPSSHDKEILLISRFLFYEFYFKFYSSDILNIFDSTKHLCIHYLLL